MAEIQFILYVKNQKRSTEFYQALLGLEPTLFVPGMTEFRFSADCKLGLMPESSIQKILHHKVPHPSMGHGIPRCELYLSVENPFATLEKALDLGAVLIDRERNRDWGDSVGYCADLDGHILAFARKIKTEKN